MILRNPAQNHALRSTGPRSMLGEPILPKNLRSFPMEMTDDNRPERVPDMTASLTGYLTFPPSTQTPSPGGLPADENQSALSAASAHGLDASHSWLRTRVPPGARSFLSLLEY